MNVRLEGGRHRGRGVRQAGGGSMHPSVPRDGNHPTRALLLETPTPNGRSLPSLRPDTWIARHAPAHCPFAHRPTSSRGRPTSNLPVVPGVQDGQHTPLPRREPLRRRWTTSMTSITLTSSPHTDGQRPPPTVLTAILRPTATHSHRCHRAPWGMRRTSSRWRSLPQASSTVLVSRLDLPALMSLCHDALPSPYSRLPSHLPPS